MSDHIPDATKMVPDGYYTALVNYDTGGEMRVYVRVVEKKAYSASGRLLKSSACSEFEPCNTWDYIYGFPKAAAAELDTLRTANAALVEKVNRLEEAGDAMAHAEGCMCDNGVVCRRCFDRARDWRKAKATP